MAAGQRSTRTKTQDKAETPVPDAALEETATVAAAPTGPTGSGAVDIALPPAGDSPTFTLPDGRTMTEAERTARLKALTEPFPLDMIEKLPKQLQRAPRQGEPPLPKFDCKAGHPQRDSASADGIYCGGFHARSIHLDYIGHAGITERLNSVDPYWDYDFMHVDLPDWTRAAVAHLYGAGQIEEASRLIKQHGTPQSRDGGYWITLTILGITRKGFGDASGKSGANATKEVIGDALRNAAMRFGVATYLWSKSDHALALRSVEDEGPESQRAPLTEALFNERVRDALTRRDTARFLVEFGNEYGEDAMRALSVTRKGGVASNGADILNDLIGQHAATGAFTASGPQTQLVDARAQDDDARADDAWSFPAGAPESDARADDARQDGAPSEEEERAHAETDARRAREEQERAAQEEARIAQRRAQEDARQAELRAQEDARIAREAERVAAPDALMRARLLDELAGQAHVLGVSAESHLNDFIKHPKAPAGLTAENAPLDRLHTHVRASRARVVEALRKQGRATEAEHYARVAPEARDTFARLTGGGAGAERAPAQESIDA